MSIQKILTITKEEKIINKIDYIRIEVKDIVLNTAATIITSYLSIDKGCVYMTSDLISGPDYQAWGNNDDYLFEYICRKYSLHRVPNI